VEVSNFKKKKTKTLKFLNKKEPSIHDQIEEKKLTPIDEKRAQFEEMGQASVIEFLIQIRRQKIEL